MLSNQLANGLQPLCYEHHTEMRLVPVVSGNEANPTQEHRYACQESDCLVRFTSTEGYLVASHETGQVEEEILPRLRCPHDEASMYLAEIRPQERSFRLWRCPLCKTTSTSGQILVAGMLDLER